MKIVLSHAYSTTNSGDGLLVEEARALAHEAFPAAVIDVIALDPSSFDLTDGVVVHPITGTESTPSSGAIVRAMITNALRLRSCHRRVDDLVREADLVVAVGGGYLRGGRPTELFKTLVAHGCQLPTAARARATPYVYLPQSIGPFPRIVWPLIRRSLIHSTRVYLRDDRSVDELRLANVVRRPDTAILGMNWRDVPSHRWTAQEKVGVVARNLGTSRRARRYESSLLRLAKRLSAEWLVQARARGNDDTKFYDSIGVGASDLQSLRDAVSPGPEAVQAVASVRLHGAIQAIRSGVPAVHLSYERKGWGAYADLGIGSYVHNVFDFDADAVESQVRELATDPGRYWEQVASAATRVREARDAIIQDLRVVTSARDEVRAEHVGEVDRASGFPRVAKGVEGVLE